MLSYDPYRAPEFDTQTLMEAREMGLHPVNVICDEPNSQVGDNTGVSIVAFVSHIPRCGERITLQDSKTCEVKRVYYKVSRVPQSKIILLVPTVFAVHMNEPETD